MKYYRPSKTKDEWNIISHTLLMTEFNTYEGERNEERKFSKADAYSYIHTLFVGSEQACLIYIMTKVYCSYNQNWKSLTVFHPNLIVEKKERRRIELAMVCTHIVVSIPFLRVMCPLSLFWQWEVLGQALSIWSSSLVGTLWSCWWFHLTWPPSYMFAIMPHSFITGLLLHVMSKHCLWYLFFYAGYYFFILFSTAWHSFLCLTMAEQFIGLESPVPAPSPSHQSAVFGASTSPAAVSPTCDSISDIIVLE